MVKPPVLAYLLYLSMLQLWGSSGASAFAHLRLQQLPQKPPAGAAVEPGAKPWPTVTHSSPAPPWPKSNSRSVGREILTKVLCLKNWSDFVSNPNVKQPAGFVWLCKSKPGADIGSDQHHYDHMQLKHSKQELGQKGTCHRAKKVCEPEQRLVWSTTVT